jgi:hypothetical protein
VWVSWKYRACFAACGRSGHFVRLAREHLPVGLFRTHTIA